MDSFSTDINVKNISSFPQINHDRIVGIFRHEIHCFLLSRKDENEYFDLDIFSHKHCNNKHSIISIIILKICSELNDLGWKTKLGFAGTGLFIYSTDAQPISCWA